MGVGTIGSRPCEIILNELLIEFGNPRVTNKVMRNHQLLKTGLEKLKLLALKDKGFCRNMMVIHYNNIRKSFEYHKGSMPEKVYSLTLCTYAAIYRDALRNLKDLTPCDSHICNQFATKRLWKETSEWCANWFIGYYCDGCYEKIESEMKKNCLEAQ